MATESTNYLYGNAENPYNKDRCAGGSSGGEGGLIAARCSPLGMGSDIGGSIRNPGAMNGITSFKPTSGRISFYGHTYFCHAYNG
jgi:Asp-tRNA(Asn)/Glu-tRNA(Gln) amidotransferase A subunit family amidase